MKPEALLEAKLKLSCFGHLVTRQGGLFGRHECWEYKAAGGKGKTEWEMD